MKLRKFGSDNVLLHKGYYALGVVQDNTYPRSNFILACGWNGEHAIREGRIFPNTIKWPSEVPEDLQVFNSFNVSVHNSIPNLLSGSIRRFLETNLNLTLIIFEFHDRHLENFNQVIYLKGTEECLEFYNEHCQNQ